MHRNVVLAGASILNGFQCVVVPKGIVKFLYPHVGADLYESLRFKFGHLIFSKPGTKPRRMDLLGVCFSEFKESKDLLRVLFDRAPVCDVRCTYMPVPNGRYEVVHRHSFNYAPGYEHMDGSVALGQGGFYCGFSSS